MADPIRLPQVRVLFVLSKFGALSRNQICEKTKVTIGPINNALGEAGEQARKAADARKGYDSLLTRKLVKPTLSEDAKGNPMNAYAITASGSKALESAMKELGGKIPAVRDISHKTYSNAKAETNGKAPPVAKAKKPMKANAKTKPAEKEKEAANA